MSLAASSRDARPPVIAPKRGSSSVRRLALAANAPLSSSEATRSTSTAKAKSSNSGAKTRSTPVSAAAKRIAAKGASLRMRMPYLRLDAPPLPTTPVESKAHLSSPPSQRSFSSNANIHGAAQWVKSSYLAIPEALQQVKKVCNASKDSEHKESSIMAGSTNGRESRFNRPEWAAGDKSSDASKDATTVIQNIEIIQGMLFASLQTTTAGEALAQLPPRHAAAADSLVQRSKSCNSPLESRSISSFSGLFLSRKDRRKAWALLLHKQTHALPLLVNAARSPLATREADVEAAILTFLYNVLRYMSGERQRKAVLLCEKLGLVRACTAVLLENRRRLRHGVAMSSAHTPWRRACEAAALLFTLGYTFNVKLSAAFRLSQSLDCTLACAFSVFGVVETEFAAFQQTVRLAGTDKSLGEAVKAHALTHTRNDTLKALRNFQARSQWSVTAFSHFCFALFVFTGNAASAKELGSRGAELCATTIAMTTYFLSQVAPVLLTNVVYKRQEDTLHPTVGPLLAVDHAHWAPAWVVKMLRHVELMLLWCVALLHRLGSYSKVQGTVSALALRSHVPRGCLIFLAPPSKEAVQLAPRRECVHVVLLLLGALLKANRVGVLADMSDFGGLKALVTSILGLNEAAAQQWHHYYIQLASMYGCLHLPAIAGHSPCYIDQRIPASLRRLLPTSPAAASAAADHLGTSGSKDFKGGNDIACAPLQRNLAATAAAAAPPSSLYAVPLPPEEAHAQHDGDSVSLHTNSTGAQGLSPAERFESEPDVVLGPQWFQSPASQGIDLNDGLLLVDTKPNLFSPELLHGTVDPASALSEFPEGQLPWPFMDVPPPTTAEHWQGKSSHISSVTEDDHFRIPLKEVPQEDRIRVLRHHIARLVRLDEAACDTTDNPHLYKVVFERRNGAGSIVAEAEADAAVQPSQDGISFFSDFECGNLQRAVEVADNEFDLVLAWDTATNSYTQWFNFGVRNFTPGKTYYFNILNMEKLGSTFNEGQKLLLLHVPECSGGSLSPGTQKSRAPPRWQRAGHNIFYFRNSYERPARAHFFPKGVEAGNRPAATTGGGGGGAACPHVSPTTGAPQRFSPVRVNICTPPPRLSPSRTPRPPPPVVAKKRVPAMPTLSPAGANHGNSTANGGSNGDEGDDGGRKQRNYFTVTFSVTMPSEGSGRVYLANCFPYSYTELRQHVSWLAAQTQHSTTNALRVQSLCVTPGGLEVPLLTVTALHRRDSGEPYTVEEIRRRPIALLVARVHPGETNASWVMQGLLDALLRPTAATAEWTALLCENIVFKIVPMLNADGVMMGNHRCSFAGMDMNRDYLEPKAELNPALYALKQLLRHWKQEEGRQTVMFADFHGHSRAKNFLVYGCTSETIRGATSHLGGKDRNTKGRSGDGAGDGGRRRRVRVRQTSTDAPLGPEKFLAVLLNHLFPSFSLSQSSYAVTKDKASSARVVLYDEFGVRMSYGFEATMVGGRLCVPSMLLPLADPAGAGRMLWKEEVHYSPVVFHAMGEAFICSFAVLLEQWITVTKAAAATSESCSSSNGNDKLHKCGAEVQGGCSADVVQALWSATAAAGSGRDAPKGPLEELAKDISCTPRAGPYASATRGDRRQGELTSLSPNTITNGTAPHSAVAHPPAVSAAGQLDALNYLFLAHQREAAVLEGDYEDADDDADQRTVDDSDVSSLVDGSDTEVVGKMQRAGRGEKGDSGDDLEAGERSPSSAPSDSGSDDHDWSGFNSSESSAGEDIDVERSSACSIDEDIPTNLFK
ncbi:zinc carboxypeptidase putative metallo-peptidase Clan MC Family M14 [Leptomonas seymouri]|uniref:Zinc carboxypeptidase putative metallo-peptidase Clan MC Family M14 n=1 Tax=Leptomonas seymouri TaxID=5684 RepID=A0A0N1PEA1_LEPSE|nr:zinc carboxypeptidase putative metallo-peptidase Clan MC Family M14 [Leptomonas seymouri]|eukprot:KPI86862.1 zinc carboxypeptidase putative metallo-peptidase Clan MC Family M14 [Leptomonas seymouri]